MIRGPTDRPGVDSPNEAIEDLSAARHVRTRPQAGAVPSLGAPWRGGTTPQLRPLPLGFPCLLAASVLLVFFDGKFST